MDLIKRALRPIKARAYRRGYRPKPGSILFSPSLDIVYAIRDNCPSEALKEALRRAHS